MFSERNLSEMLSALRTWSHSVSSIVSLIAQRINTATTAKANGEKDAI